MNTTLLQNWKKNRQFLVFFIPVLLLGSLIFLIKSSYFNKGMVQTDYFDLAISIDFVITIPIIYFLIIRKTRIPNLTALTLMIAGLFLGLHFLPKEHQNYLEIFKTYFFPVIELGVLSIIIWKVTKAITKYKNLKSNAVEKISFDFFTILKNSCKEILPKLPATLLATEIAVIYYAIINWKTYKINPKKEFTYHATSGTIGLLGALVFIIAIETIALHLLLAEWNSTIAWVLTVLSIYTGFQLLAFAKSFLKRPIMIENDTLYLRYGIMSETEIELKNIKSIEISEKPLEELKEIEKNKNSKLYQKLSPLGNLEQHNILIQLHKKVKLNGIYGINKEFEVLAFHVDEKVNFTNQIQDNIES